LNKDLLNDKIVYLEFRKQFSVCAIRKKFIKIQVNKQVIKRKE